MNAYFLFIGSLNDFLNHRQKDQQIQISFHGNPGIKDIIESLGVPHVEIQQILVNSVAVDFSYQLESGDVVQIFPFTYGPLPAQKEKPSFVLDVHLGKLARYLRMMGFDSVYKNDFSDRELVNISCTDLRVLLTRDIGVLKYGCLRYGYWVRATNALIQAKEIVTRYRLCPLISPFSLCMECNYPLIPVSKFLIENRIQNLTREHYNTFSQCVNCLKIYWPGSHFHKMNDLIKQICPQNS